MRPTFFETLLELAVDDPRINLVVGDLGFGAVEPFRTRFPDRFVNVGVAEQNMTAIAAGMALSGKLVFTYSIANFPTLRCLEQIRNDVCYHRADVKIVAVGGGFAYGALGMSHHATEDLAILRALPEMMVVAPGDPVEVRAATRAIAATSGPCYLRLGRAGEPSIHAIDVPFTLGRGIVVRDGGDLTMISTGAILPLVVRLAGILAADGIATRVISMHTVKPIDVDAVVAAAHETRAIVTVEEHSVLGGLGGAVAEILAELDHPKVPFRRFGLPSAFAREVGSQDRLRSAAGLSEVGLLRALKPILDIIRR